MKDRKYSRVECLLFYGFGERRSLLGRVHVPSEFQLVALVLPNAISDVKAQMYSHLVGLLDGSG